MPVNIAEGGGRTGLHAAGVSGTDAASPRFEHFTGKVFSIHSSPGATMQGLCALRGYTVFAVKRMDECLPDSSHKAYGREKLVTTRTRGRRTHPVGACFPLIRRRAAPSMSMGLAGCVVCQGMGHRQACSGF